MVQGRCTHATANLMTEATISSVEPQLVLPLFGARDQHLRRLRERFDVDITHRNGQIRVTGDDESVALATEVLERLKGIVQRKGALTPHAFDSVISQVTGDPLPVESHGPIDVMQVGRQIRPRTPGQVRYVEMIRQKDIVFAVGPAGTGKTYMAVATAVEALKHRSIRKVVLVRPAVEAGESLGFLPGDLQAKINPYLRPLFDALNDMIGYDQAQHLIHQETIEVVPLAYMRGRTLNDAFIILDEAQNTTIAQMKMFLTRMGEHSKVVVSGDTTQVDLPRGSQSGLRDALHRLRAIEGVGIVRLTQSDIVRHALVQHIVEAYERNARGSRAADDAPGRERRSRPSSDRSGSNGAIETE